jgi:hypothetical protein
MSATVGPDFLCVGMLKGGTRWLFDQLQYHPEFWMPPIKELHYFDRGPTRGENARKALDLASRSRRKTQSADREYDERDITFLREMASHAGLLDMSLYAALFRQKGDKISGDITPHYCTLDDETIAEITGYLSDLRVLLLIRDPIARAWSQISQAGRRDMFSAEMLEKPEEFRAALTGWKKLIRLSSATNAAKRWMSHVGESRFRFIFMDDIAGQPENTRRSMLEFLGADPAKSSGEIPPDHNPKSSGFKFELNEKSKACLVEHLKDELRAGAEFFGGHAKDWAARYGV